MRRLPLLLLVLCAPLLMGEASRNFDGTDDELDGGAIDDVTTGNVSACVWWKGTEDAGSDRVMGKRNDDSATTAGWAFRQSTGDNMQFMVGDGTAGLNSISTSDTDAAWFHCCATWDGTNNVIVLYINGTQEDTDTASIGSLTNASNFQLGEDHANGNDANGLISYGWVERGTIMTSMQINEVLWFPDRGPAVIGTNLDSFWSIWGSSSPENDLSGNGNTLTVVAGAAASTDGPPVMFGEGLPL